MTGLCGAKFGDIVRVDDGYGFTLFGLDGHPLASFVYVNEQQARHAASILQVATEHAVRVLLPGPFFSLVMPVPT